jgi:thiol-disulfide isomerase/thioredoxin
MLRKLLTSACLLTIIPLAWGQTAKKKPAPIVGSKEFAEMVDYKKTGAPLPSLKIYTREGTYLNEQDLKNDANLILMLFNPTCEHCEDMTRDFEKHIYLFKKTNIVLLAAPGMGPYLDYFVKTTKVDQYPTLKVGLDSMDYIDKTFKYVTLPQINIYDKDRKLIKMFFGSTPMDSLRAYIE